ncbi:MAG: MBL fold metallo-hydrolase [Candidatus Micrarchaeota archaeon]
MNYATFGPVKITYFGHASICLEFQGMAIYVDPYVLARNCRRADIILHTHSHPDHCVLPNSLLSSSTRVIGRGSKFPGQEMKIGDKIKVHGILIEAVHAYNKNKPFHPKDFGAGFFFTFPTTREPVKVYVAGDTDLIDEMKNCKCDVAILPIGGTYTMNAEEAAQALTYLKPKIAIPYHYNYLSDTNADPQAFLRMAKILSPQTEVRILTP